MAEWFDTYISSDPFSLSKEAVTQTSGNVYINLTLRTI